MVMTGLHWLRNLKRPVRRSARRHHAVESRGCERLENRCLLTADAGMFDFAAPQSITFPSDFYTDGFIGEFVEYGGVIFVLGRVGSGVGDDVYYQLESADDGNLVRPDAPILLSTTNNHRFFSQLAIVNDEVVFAGTGQLDDGELRVVYQSVDGTVVGLPHPGVEFGVTNSALLIANASGSIVLTGSGPIYVGSLSDVGNYIPIPVRDNVAGRATAISEDGTFVFGEDGAGVGPTVIWRRDVDAGSGAVFYTKLQIGAPDIGSPNSLTRSITNDFFPLEYVDIDFETFDFTQYVGLWQSSDAAFVRGFENGHEPYIAKHDGVNYLLYSGPDPVSVGQEMLYLYVDGADDAVPLRDFYAERNVSLASPGLGEIARVIEFSFASTGKLLILGESYQDGSDELVTTFSIFPAFDSEPVAAPVFTSSATPSVVENTVGVVTLAATDADRDPVTFSITGGADETKFEIVSGTLQFKAAPNFEAPSSDAMSNTYLVTVTADDGRGGTTTQNLSVSVTNINEAPTVANVIPDQNATEDAAFSFPFAANAFADVDVGDSLTYSTGSLPSWLSFDPGTRTFSGTPQNTDVGIVSIQVTATDTSSVSISDTFDLAVLGVAVVTSSGTATISDVGGESHDQVGAALSDDGLSLVLTVEGVTTTIPLAGLTNLVFNGGGGDDTLTLDFSNGALSFNITFNGGVGGDDRLAVIGDDVDDSVNYTPGLATGSGTLSYNDGVNVRMVVILELEPVDITGVPSVAVSGSSGVDNFTLSNGFDSTMGGLIPAVVVIGKRNGVTIEAPHIWNVGSLTIDTGAGNDVINASVISLAVVLIGGAGNDTLTGGAGNDTLSGGAGKDSLNGGAGSDTVVETAADAVMTLTNTQLTGNGTDKLTNIERAVLTGTVGHNTLDASAFTLGNATLLGGAGNDTLLGSAFTGAVDADNFNDSLDGGAGVDLARQVSRTSQTLTIGATPDTNEVTGTGRDLWRSIESLHFIGTGKTATTLNAAQFTGSVTLAGGSGNDMLIGGSGSNDLSGNAGNDVLTGGEAADALSGGAGNDLLVGNGGNDLLKGQAGNDTLRGNSGDDQMFGDVGNDKLFGGNGSDLLDGGAGGDVLTGEVGDDTINAGAGNDAISGGSGNDVLNGSLGNDTILGGSGNDVLRSGGGADRLAGDSGNDRFLASGSRLNLGGGDDTISGSRNTIDAIFIFDFEKLLV